MKVTLNLNTFYQGQNLNNEKLNNNCWQTKITFKGDNDTFNYDEKFKENKEKYSWYVRGKNKKAKNDTNQQLVGFNLNQEQLRKQQNETIKAKEVIIEKMEDNLKLSKEKSDILEKQLEDAKKNNLSAEAIFKIKEDLAKEIVEQFKAKSVVETEKENLTKIKDAHELLTQQRAGQGWDKIAGQLEIKEKLNDWFINKLALEKGGERVTMPNSVLFFGPKSTGKTYFAKAFAEQSKCNFVPIEMLQDNEDILIDLKSEAKKAKQLYENSDNKQRTIILLDEFDSIAKYSDEEKAQIAAGKAKSYEEFNVNNLKNFLENCAEKYKCTVFMTTNFPLNIESELLKDDYIPARVYLGPPEDENVTELFKHYLKGATNQPINYEALTDEVMSYRVAGEAYSAGRIAKIINELVTTIKGTGQEITQGNIIDAIKEYGPDIDEMSLQRFAEEVETMTKE